MSPENPFGLAWYHFWRLLARMVSGAWQSRIMRIAVWPWTAKGWRLGMRTETGQEEEE